MSKRAGSYQDNIHGWPYAFGEWLRRVGIKNGQLLTSMDLFALAEYRKEWNEMGIAAPVHYDHARQILWEQERAEAKQEKSL